MKLIKIVESLGLQVVAAEEALDKDLSSGYTSDLLSDVIANSEEGSLWITLQTHQNTIAVAKLKDLAGIIFVNNRTPNEDTIKKANEEHVPLLLTEESAYSISGKLYRLVNEEC